MDFNSIPISAASQIASYSPLHGPKGLHIETVQVKHRIKLINSWNIEPGSRVLELGCGQGTCTSSLAYAVGPTGHVDAVDPAPPDYGSPFTLAQAQEFMSASEVGPRISWHRATPEEHLQGNEGDKWDVAVLAHCIWYFQDEEMLKSILRALKGRVKRICVAEYAFKASNPLAVPHLLAAIARGTLEAHKTESIENIRTPLSPAAIKAIAKIEGWVIGQEREIIPENAPDGAWEAGSTLSDDFLQEVDMTDNRRIKSVLYSAREATKAAVEAIGGIANVETMDVWSGDFYESAKE
ncbi:hypothetical protein ABW20_dc0107175 [Dactylellina cionopaga]|nr:hypothetical protein ABW20_dc0107175 [Dactylellina cionopaga]